jgi:hypothetical protein
MKIWNGYGSEHSMSLVMIGRFKDAGSAEAAKEAIEDLQEYFREHDPETITYPDTLMALFSKLKVHTLTPAEFSQFLDSFSLDFTGRDVTIRTDESEISGLCKLLVERGAKVEMFSTHYREEGDDTKA